MGLEAPVIIMLAGAIMAAWLSAGADVYGYSPGTVFNRHAGPSAQMWGLDDFVSAGFDPTTHGFVGGATPNVENQQLPIQISREGLPPGVLTWGKGYRDHLRRGHRFRGVCSSHDLGGCRMGEDPVHDTPGLYVFGEAAFPTRPGVNPTLTIWALCSRASDRLIERDEGVGDHGT